MKIPGDEVLRFMSFNQDGSRLAIGTKTGFRTFACDPFRPLYEYHGDGASIVEMLYNSSLVAQVGSGDAAGSSQRNIHLFNTKKQKEIVRKTFSSPVLSIKLNRKRLIGVLETSIYIYDISNMNQLHVIQETPPNPSGICALANATAEGSYDYMAYPASAIKGEVCIYDVVNQRAIRTFEAHTSPISCLALNSNGDRLATASSKGTIIRVFNVVNGDTLFELRRGLASNAIITSINFSASSNMISVSSDKQTVHLFRLEAPAPVAEASAASSWTSWAVGAVSYLDITGTLSQVRSFAQINLPRPGVLNVSAIWEDSRNLLVFVMTSDGYFYKYEVNQDAGGLCKELACHRLLSDGSAAQEASGDLVNFGADEAPATTE